MSSLIQDTPKATSREWIGLAVLALPCLLYSMDLTVLNLAVPKLSADLQPNSTELLWIVDIYGFMLAGALIPMGVLGDRIGRRRLLLIGAAAFGCASILAAFSTSVEMLIAARALLGLAAATLAPSTLSLIRNMFPDPQQRTFAIGVWIASFSAGGAIGPLVGGAMLEFFWWGSVFLINVPIMLLLLAVGPILLREFRDPTPRRIDIASAALSLFAVLAIIYGIKHMAEYGINETAGVSIVVGLLIGVVFLRRQKKLSHPFIDLGLFRHLAFSTALTINIFGFFVAFAMFLLIAQYLQLVLGLSPLEAGLWSAPSGVAFVIGSLLSPKLLNLWRPAYVIAIGFALASLGFGMLTQVGSVHDLPLLVVAYVVFSLGLAPPFTLTADLVVSTAPPEQAGAAAGISEMTVEFGGALGIALLGSLVTVIYRGSLDGASLGQLAPGTLETVRDTLGGALAVAETLPEQLGSSLITLARQAYIEAFQAAAITCTLLSITAAISTGWLLGRIRATSAPVAEDAAAS